MKGLGVITLALTLTACLPGQAAVNQAPQAVPTVDLNLTAEALTETVVAKTAQSLPTTTLIPSTTFTLIPSPTSSGLPTATGTLSVISLAGSPTLNTAGLPASKPFAIDTLPPGTDYAPLHLENRSNRHVDVTLYCTTGQGYETILDYSNIRSLTIDAPQGDYSYVAYVGGVKFTGSFSFFTAQKLTLTFYRDRVAIH